jgi:hypothetical protein
LAAAGVTPGKLTVPVLRKAPNAAMVWNTRFAPAASAVVLELIVAVAAPRPVVPPSVLHIFALTTVVDAPTAVNAPDAIIKPKPNHVHTLESFLKSWALVAHSLIASDIAA